MIETVSSLTKKVEAQVDRENKAIQLLDSVGLYKDAKQLAQDYEGVIIAPKDKYEQTLQEMTSKSGKLQEDNISFNMTQNPMKYHNLLHKHIETGKAELLRKGGYPSSNLDSVMDKKKIRQLLIENQNILKTQIGEFTPANSHYMN